jgi:hypothetical protein
MGDFSDPIVYGGRMNLAPLPLQSTTFHARQAASEAIH